MKKKLIWIVLSVVIVAQLMVLPVLAAPGDELFKTDTVLITRLDLRDDFKYDAKTNTYTPPAIIVQDNDAGLGKYVSSSGSSTSKERFSGSVSRWAHRIAEQTVINADGTIDIIWQNTLQSGEKYIRIDTYDRSWNLLKIKQVPCEMDIFGGIYIGEKYNYIAFGQNNPNEDDTLEVIRLVKYDKAFNRIDAVSVTDCYTTVPFDAGSLRMAEKDNTLVMHTARVRYMTEDGLNHQSQLTIYFNTDSMRVTNDLGRVQPNHVSHSFNQFVKFDGSSVVLVDHGDGYPRGIVLNKSRNDGSSYSKLDLLKVPGETGANCTGINVGGFMISADNYIVAINTVDQSQVTGYDSFEIYGLEREERDAVLLVSGRSNTSTANVKQLYLTDYVGQGLSAGIPKLVDLGNDRYMVLWTEYSYSKQGEDIFEQLEKHPGSVGVRYIIVDGNGDPVTESKFLPDAEIGVSSSFTIIDNYLTWFIDNEKVTTYRNGEERIPIETSTRTFYQLDLGEETERMVFTIGNKQANIFGEDVYYDVAPLIVNSRTMLPARFVAEALGAEVRWNEAKREVSITRDDMEIRLYIDSNIAYINGESVALDSPAIIIDGRTYTPVRFVAEALGATVTWFGTESKVKITK